MTFSSTRVKLSQIPHVNFELASQLLFQFCIILHCHDTKLPANFNLIHFLLWIKGYHQSLNFKTSGHALVKENLLNSSCHFCNQKSVFLQMLHQDSVPSNITPLNFFLAQILYTLFKRSSIKCKFLRFLSANVSANVLKGSPLKLASAIFYQMIALQKLWKMFFISPKKLISFSRYSNFYIFAFPSFFPCQSLL